MAVSSDVLEERVNNMKEQNDTDHKAILGAVHELRGLFEGIMLNKADKAEVADLTKRINKLETTSAKNVATISAIASAIAVIITAILQIIFKLI